MTEVELLVLSAVRLILSLVGEARAVQLVSEEARAQANALADEVARARVAAEESVRAAKKAKMDDDALKAVDDLRKLKAKVP